jgi:PRC-barrel domain protein
MRGKIRISIFVVSAFAVGTCAIAVLAAAERPSLAGNLARVAQASEPPNEKPNSRGNAAATGTPAAVLDDRDVESILGKGIRSSTGENMGRIVDVIVSRSGHIRGAVVDFGGFLGVGSRKIAVDWSALRFNVGEKPGSVVVDLTKDQLRVAPEYKSGEPVVILGAATPPAQPGASPSAQDK